MKLQDINIQPACAQVGDLSPLCSNLPHFSNRSTCMSFYFIPAFSCPAISCPSFSRRTFSAPPVVLHAVRSTQYAVRSAISTTTGLRSCRICDSDWLWHCDSSSKWTRHV